MGRKLGAAALVAIVMTLGRVVPAWAGYLPPGQQSPCRPNAPAGEQILGYSDEGPQDDPRRELPTIYYNTSPGNTYLGACGGGSVGEPIRYAEIRFTPAGPYLYATDGTGQKTVGTCLPGPPVGVPDSEGGVNRIDQVCAAGGSTTGDAADLNGSAREDDSYDDGWYGTANSYKVTATQNGVEFERATSDAFEQTSTRYFVRRNQSTGAVQVGTGDDSNAYDHCETYVEASFATAAPPTLHEGNPDDGCFGPTALIGYALFLANSYANSVVHQIPQGPQSFASCRPSPAPAGEQQVAGSPTSPLTLYYNAEHGYAGLCDSGPAAGSGRSIEAGTESGVPYLRGQEGTCGTYTGAVAVVVQNTCARATVTAGDPPSVSATHSGCEQASPLFTSNGDCSATRGVTAQGSNASITETPCGAAVTGFSVGYQGSVVCTTTSASSGGSSPSATTGGSTGSCTVLFPPDTSGDFGNSEVAGCASASVPATPTDAAGDVYLSEVQSSGGCITCIWIITHHVHADQNGVYYEREEGYGFDNTLLSRVAVQREPSGVVTLDSYSRDDPQGTDCKATTITYDPNNPSQTPQAASSTACR